MGMSAGGGVTAKPTVKTKAARTSILFSIRFLLSGIGSIAYESYDTALCLFGRTLPVGFRNLEQNVWVWWYHPFFEVQLRTYKECRESREKARWSVPRWRTCSKTPCPESQPYLVRLCTWHL